MEDVIGCRLTAAPYLTGLLCHVPGGLAGSSVCNFGLMCPSVTHISQKINVLSSVQVIMLKTKLRLQY